jgi:hypothetical protein
LTACEGDELPIDYVYVIDVPHSVCAKKEIIDKENLIFKHVEDLPLMECDGNVSIAKEDWPALRSWIRSAIKKLKECQSALQKVIE